MTRRSQAHATWSRLARLGALALMLWLPAMCARADASSRQFWFAHAADPQIGYGEDGRSRDADRFERLLAALDARGAAFVVIAGDLVQDRTFLQWRAFEQARKGAKLPLYLAPGNHDIVDVASLEDYRDRIGRDYYTADAKGVTLVIVDSETARDRTISGKEFSEQWAWLDATLVKCRTAQQPCMLVTHRPPFVDAVDEPEDPRNWPPDTRAQLLRMLKDNGVQHVLAGHLHTTHVAHDAASGVTIYSVGGTARVHDEQGFGYREMRLPAGKLQQRYVRMHELRAYTSFMGIEGWTPRIVHPTLRHSLLTLGECIAGCLFIMVAAAWRRAGLVLPRSTGRSLWLLLGSLQIFFGINEQLDLDELLLVSLRGLARTQGWVDIRHQVGAMVAGATVLLAIVGVCWLIARAGKARKLALLPIAMLAVPSAWFVLSVLSDHGFAMVLSLDAWDVLLFGATLVSIITGRRALRRACRTKN